MNWIRERTHIIAAVLAVLLAVLAGIVVGGILVFLSGFWLVVGGELGDMVLTSWGY